MAFQNDLLQSDYGVSFLGAYFRINTASVDRLVIPNGKFHVSITLLVYATAPPNEFTKQIGICKYMVPIDEIEVQSGDTFLARCYQWVMAQPDMVGAIAV